MRMRKERMMQATKQTVGTCSPVVRRRRRKWAARFGKVNVPSPGWAGPQLARHVWTALTPRGARLLRPHSDDHVMAPCSTRRRRLDRPAVASFARPRRVAKTGPACEYFRVVIRHFLHCRRSFTCFQVLNLFELPFFSVHLAPILTAAQSQCNHTCFLQIHLSTFKF